ncbi:hypothetical protein ABE85_15810 [Mitsuaria sp. 7]|nr:hypothetical protein ABE85_15810 [Mitsuaria sp. 7]
MSDSSSVLPPPLALTPALSRKRERESDWLYSQRLLLLLPLLLAGEGGGEGQRPSQSARQTVYTWILNVAAAPRSSQRDACRFTAPAVVVRILLDVR